MSKTKKLKARIAELEQENSQLLQELAEQDQMFMEIDIEISNLKEKALEHKKRFDETHQRFWKAQTEAHFYRNIIEFIVKQEQENEYS